MVLFLLDPSWLLLLLLRLVSPPVKNLNGVTFWDQNLGFDCVLAYYLENCNVTKEFVAPKALTFCYTS